MLLLNLCIRINVFIAQVCKMVNLKHIYWKVRQPNTNFVMFKSSGYRATLNCLADSYI